MAFFGEGTVIRGGERRRRKCATFASVPTWCDPSFYRVLVGPPYVSSEVGMGNNNPT